MHVDESKENDRFVIPEARKASRRTMLFVSKSPPRSPEKTESTCHQPIALKVGMAAHCALHLWPGLALPGRKPGVSFSMDELFFPVPAVSAMSSVNAQVSATVASSTKEKLDRFTEELGLKKNYVVEQALLFFMQARRELPDEAFIPTRLVLDDAAFARIAAQLKARPEPSAALRELMRAEGA